MYTLADEKIDSAEDHIINALKDMSDVCIDRVSGWDEYSDIAKEKYNTILKKLMEIRELF